MIYIYIHDMIIYICVYVIVRFVRRFARMNCESFFSDYEHLHTAQSRQDPSSGFSFLLFSPCCSPSLSYRYTESYIMTYIDIYIHESPPSILRIRWFTDIRVHDNNIGCDCPTPESRRDVKSPRIISRRIFSRR